MPVLDHYEAVVGGPDPILGSLHASLLRFQRVGEETPYGIDDHCGVVVPGDNVEAVLTSRAERRQRLEFAAVS